MGARMHELGHSFIRVLFVDGLSSWMVCLWGGGGGEEQCSVISETVSCIQTRTDQRALITDDLLADHCKRGG
jgi:hypothetical protein